MLLACFCCSAPLSHPWHVGSDPTLAVLSNASVDDVPCNEWPLRRLTSPAVENETCCTVLQPFLPLQGLFSDVPDLLLI